MKQRRETGESKALPPSSLIDRMRQELPAMKRADRAVADALLENIDAATRSSVKALAGRAGVSEPSVIRFARHMGCEGFSDFKIRLAQDYAIGRMYLSADYQHPTKTGSDVAGHVYEATSQALASAFAQRDPAALDRAADLIDGSRRVFCFGVGGSSANVAAEAENRLFRLDLAASATADAYKQRITAATERAENLIHLEPCFYVGAALRHGRRPLSPEAFDQLISSLDRLAIMGNATAPLVLAWLIEKQTVIGKAR